MIGRQAFLPKRLAWAVALALATGFSPAAGASSWPGGDDGFTALGTLGGANSYVTDLNDSGQVSGTAWLASGKLHAFLWSGGVLRDLGTLCQVQGLFDCSSYESWGRGLNALGQVAGNSMRFTMYGDFSQPFVYDSVQGMRHVNLENGGLQTYRNIYGMDINDAGLVAGYRHVDASWSAVGYVYDLNTGQWSDLPRFGTGWNLARAINNAGQVVGVSWRSGGYDGAALWSGNQITFIDSLLPAGSGWIMTDAFGINDSGQIVGTGLYNGAAAAWHYADGAAVNLGGLGGTATTPYAINADGMVVGGSRTADGVEHAFLWLDGRMHDLNALAPSGWVLNSGRAINEQGQIAGNGTHDGVIEAFVLAIRMEWQGGNGAWEDTARWRWLGEAGTAPGTIHHVDIHPAGSATVLGGGDTTLRSLTIGGDTGQLVALNLNGGSTLATQGTILEANGMLVGSGRLGGKLSVNAGGRIEVAWGEHMQLTGGTLSNAGAVRVFGTEEEAAVLDVGGPAGNAGQINLQTANVSFLGGLANSGSVNVSFGVSNVAGVIDNQAGGRIVVSNGANASFYDAIVNNGELRVSAGGAANLFGLVSGAGSFTGTGQARFEGGFAPGNSPALVTVGFAATYSSSSPITMELGGTTPGIGDGFHDKLVFNGPVTLEGGPLNVVWWKSYAGQAGDVYDLFDWNGGRDGVFGVVSLPDLEEGLLWETGTLYTTGEISVAAVPDAETWAMLLAGLGMLGLRLHPSHRARRGDLFDHFGQYTESRGIAHSQPAHRRTS